MSEHTMNPDLSVNIEMKIAAPVHAVYSAMTDAETGKRWWAGPPFEFTNLTLDARPGGDFVYAIRNVEDGSTYETRGTYRVAIPDERLEWTNAEGGGTVASVTFAETEGFTTLHVCQGNFESSAQRDRHQQGWEGCLDQLKTLLEGKS